MNKKFLSILLAALLALAAIGTASAQEATEPLSIAEQGLFSAGGTVTEPVEGEYDPTTSWMDATRAGNTAHVGHANVLYQIPAEDNGNPIVYLHGYGQSRMGWMTTPDGREGWATYFLRNGHSAYLVDQPGRGEAGAIVAERSVRDMVSPRVAAKHHQFYGYGLSVGFMRDLTVYRHGGSLPGVSSHIAWSPELERGAVVLCNTQNVPVSLIADALLRIAAGWEPQPEDLWTDCPWEPEVIEAAYGRYRSGEGAEVVIERDGSGISVLNDGKPANVRMVRGRMALLRSGFAVSELRPCFSEDGTVWGLRLNDRIVPKVG